VLADEASRRLFIADSNHHRIVVARLDGLLIDVVGSGELGADDGGYTDATFNHPQGMALHGETLYVADTENHLLRKIDLDRKQVTTIAGTGKQRRSFAWPGTQLGDFNANGKLLNPPDRFVAKPLDTAINSPWDLYIHGNDLFVAMAGPHQIWRMSLDEKEIGPYAGNGRADIVDGPLLPNQPYEEGFASFAQPSGLTSDGSLLYVADSEGSSIRAVPLDGEGKVRTVIGTSLMSAARLFTFGDVDGHGTKVRLQHPLAVAYYKDRLYVADTYNNKIKAIDPESQTCKTISGTGKPGTEEEPAEFTEPAGLSAAAGKLFVADTNNHLIRVIDLGNDAAVSTLDIAGLDPPEIDDEAELEAAASALPGTKTINVAKAVVRPQDGVLRLAVSLKLPEGYKINPQAPMSYRVEADGADGPISRDSLGKANKLDEPAASFEIELPVSEDTGNDELKVSLTYYYCQEGGAGLCKMGSVGWHVPVELSEDATRSDVPLKLDVK
jgi:DNA-binding beta-propeller fold protein YncE